MIDFPQPMEPVSMTREPIKYGQALHGWMNEAFEIYRNCLGALGEPEEPLSVKRMLVRTSVLCRYGILAEQAAIETCSAEGHREAIVLLSMAYDQSAEFNKVLVGLRVELDNRGL